MSPDPTGLSWKGYEGQDYEGFWIGPGKHYLDLLERGIAAHTLPGGDAVLEIGAGFGRLGSCYVGRYHQVHMVEPASNLRDIAQHTYGDRVNYHDASVFDLPFADGTFDGVLMVRVFHHLSDPDAALREIHRVIRAGGRLVFNYSNKRNLARIPRYLAGGGASPFSRDMETYNSVLIGHHPQHVEGMLEQIGFVIREQYAVGVMDKAVERMPWLGRVMTPSLAAARFAARFRLSPSQFIVAEKR
ncbi:MAG TPA: class I SAM-dependent methyltransferase [Vicinamibacterales bacterium]